MTKWSEINSKPDRRMLRQFGCAGFAALAILATVQYRASRHALGLGLALAGLLSGGAGLFCPRVLRRPFVGWMKMAFPVNWLVSQITLGLMYYAILTPLALVFRAAGRDALGLKAAPERDSFWVQKPAHTEPRRYFRQY